MATFIIIRLHPDQALAGAEFANYLNGVTITAFDLSCGNPKQGLQVGSATYLPPPNAAKPWIPDPSTGIVQHFTVPILPIVPTPEAVATAVIEVSEPPGYKEYVSPDLRIEVARSGALVSGKNFFYDVAVATMGSAPAPNSFPGLSPTSLYLQLPAPIAAGLASVDLSDDGTPPNFLALKNAVTTVLSADQQTVPPAVLGKLTPDQARHIAFEIVWGPQGQLPDPPPPPPPTGLGAFDGVGALYTDPPNDGTIGNTMEQNRQQFEGNLNSYYATRNAKVDRLARFVFALSAAVACEELSVNAKAALLQFPVNPAAVGSQATITVTEVVLVDGTGGGNPLVPPFTVPAEYFYVLGAQLPAQMGPDQRFKVACRDTQERLLPILSAAFEDGTISPNPAVNPAQAVRRLSALAPAPQTMTPRCKLDAAVLPLVNDWLNFPAPADWVDYQPGDDPVKFWTPELAGQPLAYLNLVLCALTDAYQPLIGAVLALPVGSVPALAALTEAQWQALFGTPPDVTLLPPFTLPGTPEARVAAFIRHVQKFFQVSVLVSGLPPATADAPPVLDLPGFDCFALFVAEYAALIGGPFSFGTGPLNDTEVNAAVQVVFSGDAPAQAWLKQRVYLLNDLCLLAGVVSSTTVPPVLTPAFSIAESLYARGFTSVADINLVTLTDFAEALRGTVAYSDAAAIYARAGAVGPPPPPPPGPFHPINPGSLVNCIPPCYLSPLGPVAYLHELLQLSEQSSCEAPFAAPLPERPALAGALAARRGPLGDLAVTAANAQTQIPLVDIVNENLEYLVATLPAQPQGVVHDTAADQLAGHDLCPPDEDELECCAEGSHRPEPETCRHPGAPHGSSGSCGASGEDGCHDPASLFAALPEHSAPAVPVAQTSAYERLKTDFSAPTLPYCERLDVCRSYLERLGSCRFETMRTFRREITEFALDPDLAAPVFQSHLWRLPVAIGIAIEYLQLSPEEYALLFLNEITDLPAPGHLVLYELYGFDSPNPGGTDWLQVVSRLPEFLKRTGLSYCELLDLHKAGCFGFEFHETATRPPVALPDCPPCCLERYSTVFTDPADPKEALRKLAIFLRLWRKLNCVCGARYSFAELCDICEVLQLFQGPSVNPDFIRQLVAFQMLRDRFRLQLNDGSALPGSHGAERCHLLALWVGTSSPHWPWAVGHLLDRLQRYAVKRHHCREREPRFIKLLASNLDPLSILAGFDPARAGDSWQALPAHTLRFAELLAKIYASSFGVGEILYLFSADEHLDGDDPFPLQDPNEACDQPLGLPEDDPAHGLWALRRELLEAEVDEEERCAWNWPRIEAAIRHEFGYRVPAGGTDYLLSLGRHCFPGVLERSGTPVAALDRQYRVGLATPSPEMWSIPPDGPFRYDSSAAELFTRLPLRDQAVVEKLEHLRDLTASERQAVQQLYFLPRVDLAPFACFFPSFAAAEKHLIEEADEEKRWDWFRGHFALAHRRCRLIAEHLARHVQEATASECAPDYRTAWLILRHLFADENRALGSWEDDSGALPGLTWQPLPGGGGFAALLGVTGTGLLGELRGAPGLPAWREVRGPMAAFGKERNRHNAPEPTVIPAFDVTLGPDQLRFVALRNGFAVQDEQGRPLGGAEGFRVEWSGVLLVEEEGRYRFAAGAPTPEGQEPDFERAERSGWRVTLSRGQKSWVVLCHRWPGERGFESALPLKCGAYRIVVEFVQPPPDFSGVDDIFPQHTGFQLKYSGPDTAGLLESLPLRRLYREYKDDTLGSGMELPQASSAGLLLNLLYTSTLRDIRRTYQRAFKALLFAHRFGLTGHEVPHYRASELGYLLGHGELFAGFSYYRNPVSFSRHAAGFDFNFLPLKDRYYPPAPAQDQRVQPSPKREQALFDWWERIFDYRALQRAREKAAERPVWLLFQDALQKQPDNPAQLLRHLDVDLRHAGLVLSYFDGQTRPVYQVSSDDLEDERWAVRGWHGDRWVRRLIGHFPPRDVTKGRPDLWASDDPGAIVTGESAAGDANLTRFLRDGCIENGEPRRYQEIQRLNDCLRERARLALVSYLCGMNRVPLPWGGTAQTPRELSELLLIDVEAGLCQKASRIEEAVTAAQNFIQRARLGLEPAWNLSPEFVRLWKQEFESFRVWERCRCRTLYRENWIDWDELGKARKIEAFRLLESELRRSALTIAVPGGLEYWPETLPPVHPAVKLLQQREPSTLRLLTPAREGLGILGTPERDARPSWLAPDYTGRRGQDGNPDGTPGAEPGIVVRGRHRLPYWIEAAIRLGVKFIRVAAGGVPGAAARFRPSGFHHQPGCCDQCGCLHPELADEYYFWLVPARLFNALDQGEYYDPELQEAVPWHDEQKLPTLLDWKSAAACRLAWCRVHNGQFTQPRRSVEALQLVPMIAPDLLYLGRVGDSLAFSVSGALPPVGYLGTALPGFRYDLAPDDSVALPLLADPPPAISPYPAGLPAYPYFAFLEPGDRLFPDSPFAPAVSVAALLRCHCRFEPALKWYQTAYAPLENDNTWVECSSLSQGGDSPPSIIVPPPPPGTCCDSTARSAAEARNRAILLHYLETLLEWSHALMRRNSCEAAQQARLALDTAARILGLSPRVVGQHEPPKEQTVASFVPQFPPLNPRLMDLYCKVKDGLAQVHRCLSEARLPKAKKDCRAPYWGVEPCNCGPMDTRCGCEVREEPCRCDDERCQPQGPYRYVILVQKAQEAVAKVRELGGALLSAYDRGDAEFLAAMRARHETQLSDLTVRVRQDQWREADWQVKALRKGKEVSQTNRRYYKQLIDLGLNNGELNYQSDTIASVVLRSSAIHDEETGAALRLIPDLFVGFPCEETWLALGSKLGEMFETLARINNENAEITGTNASLELTQSGWQRRLDEWVHQVEVLDLEIEQIEIQILAAERHRDQALEELNIEQRQLEQYREAFDFLRDKFTSHELYLFLQKETAAIHGKMYELARHLAVKAQRACNFELGFSKRDFIPCEEWDDLHEGLLAGERLELALQRMETEYYDCNRREYELTKHVSLALHFPLQFLKLKLTGSCEIEIPEWMFDLDYPGQYLRRIKNLSLTIPCVTGPYTGVHCRLTLLRSRTRIDPCLPCPVTECCPDRPLNPCGCRHERREHYELCRNDRRAIRHYGAREAIATSSGRNDAGLFELNFRDERHLPFEFQGAVSCWRIELPPENNYFDLDSLTDLIMHMNYTAREGGEALRCAAQSCAAGRLPGNGWLLIDVRKDFPDVWELFQRARKKDACERALTLRIGRKLFPFLPDDPPLAVTELGIFLETAKDCATAPKIGACPCPHEEVRGSLLVEVSVDRSDDDRDDSEEREIYCVADSEYPDLYHGIGSVGVGPIDRCHERHSMTLTFGRDAGNLKRLFLLCRYDALAPSHGERLRGQIGPDQHEKGGGYHG